jgi:tetratricopeptide (TPR) repeat protein
LQDSHGRIIWSNIQVLDPARSAITRHICRDSHGGEAGLASDELADTTMDDTRMSRNAGRAVGARAFLRASAWVLLPAALAVTGCAGEAERSAPGGEAARMAAAVRHGGSGSGGGRLMMVSAAGSYLAGSFAQRNRDYGSAADYFSSVLSTDAENRSIRRSAYLSLVAGGRMEEALEIARIVVAENPGAVIASLSLVVDDVRKKQYEAASRRLEAMPRRGLNTFTVPLLLAWSKAGEKKYDEALATLAKIAEIPNFAVLAVMHQGLINDIAGRRDAAEAAYRQALGNRPTLRVVEALGAFLERQGRGQEAEEIYKSYLAENPESGALDEAFERRQGTGAAKVPPRAVADPVEGMAEVFYNLAGTLAQGRSSDPALIYGRFALYLNPDFPIGQLLVGGILESVDRAADAIAVYDKVDPKSSLSWAARLRKAGALHGLERTDEAIALLRSMAEERPADPDAPIRLGDTLRAKERFDEAAEAYSSAVRRIGTLEKRHWSVLYARGIAYERTKRWPLAEKDFLRALELTPEQPYVLNYLGYSWVDQGLHLERAQRMIERAVALRPNDGYIVDSLGWVLYRLGKYQGAAEQLERAVTLRPEDATINDHLGDAYWRVGRYTEAQFQWKRALSLDPDKELIPEIQRKLRSGLLAKNPADRPG